jgi:hypothetical protein
VSYLHCGLVISSNQKNKLKKSQQQGDKFKIDAIIIIIGARGLSKSLGIAV